jgi:hypothetical protein
MRPGAALPPPHGRRLRRQRIASLTKNPSTRKRIATERKAFPTPFFSAAPSVRPYRAGAKYLASNIGRHAGAGESGEPLWIDADVFDDRLEVVLRQRGRTFAPGPGQEAESTARGTADRGCSSFANSLTKLNTM